MEIRVSASVIIVLLLVLLCWTYCSGKMELCSNSLTGFENGTTIPATVGEPVTVSFCVQWEVSDRPFYKYFTIEHPNHITQPGNYYLLSENTTKLTVNVVVDKNTARINITITKVEHADLRNVFTVKLYTIYNHALSVAAVFTFQLKLAGVIIYPCSKNSTKIENKTLSASVNQSVSLTICAESTDTVYERISISHPNHKTDWFPQPSTVPGKLDVKVVKHHRQAYITITVNQIELADFDETFSVTVFAASESGQRLPDNSSFFFVIQETGKMELCSNSLTGFENGTTIPATVGEPVTISFCVQWEESDGTINPYIKIIHPNHLTQRGNYYLLSAVTTKLTVNVVVDKNTARINITIRNVEHADLRNVFVVEMATVYKRAVSVATVFTFQLTRAEPPSVSLFSIQAHNRKTWFVVDSRTGNVTVNTTLNNFKLMCRAEGVPTPTVLITDELWKEIKPDEPFTLANCNQPGEYTCTAKNHLGSSQSRKIIQIINPSRVTEFTAARKIWRREIRPGDDVELKCLVDGCPKQITITRGADLIAEATSFAKIFVHEIKSVNCSHMGTYTCLAKFQSGRDIYETIYLGVKKCPVSLCQLEDTPRELFPILGENVTFYVCLMSSETIHKYSGNKTKMVVTFTKAPGSSFYWTANITIYGIQASDYRTHTIMIENSNGQFNYEFTLKYKGPVSLCQLEDTPRELFPIVGENVTFSVCLLSSETIHKYSGNKTKMVVTFTKAPGSSFYWTAKITIYGIQASDYRTHTVMIENSNRQFNYEFTLKYKGPVSLCQLEDTPRELFPIVGENVTFSVCLLSSETIHKYSGNKTKMVVTFTKAPGSSFYWTAKITIYGIQASDYRTHTVMIENSNRQFNYEFTLKYKVYPVITWFTLQLWDYNTLTIIWTRNLLDRNNTSVTIPATNNTMNVTCLASGFPKPEVAVVRDNETLEMLPNGVSLIDLNDDYSGSFMCQATNILSSDSTHIRVMVSVTGRRFDVAGLQPSSDKDRQHEGPETKQSSPSQFDSSVVFAVGATIGVIVGVTIIVAFIVIRVFFQKRAQRSEAVSQNVLPNTDYEEVAGTKYESTTQKTPAIDDLDNVQYIEIQDVQYETPVAGIQTRTLISNVLKSDVEYANTVTPL